MGIVSMSTEGREGAVIVCSNEPARTPADGRKCSRREYRITRGADASHLREWSEIAQESLSQRAGAPGRLYRCRAMKSYAYGPIQRKGGTLARRPIHESF